MAILCRFSLHPNFTAHGMNTSYDNNLSCALVLIYSINRSSLELTIHPSFHLSDNQSTDPILPSNPPIDLFRDLRVDRLRLIVDHKSPLYANEYAKTKTSNYSTRYQYCISYKSYLLSSWVVVHPLQLIWQRLKN